MLVLDKRLKAAIEDSRLEYVYSKKRSELVYPATYYQVNKIGRVIELDHDGTIGLTTMEELNLAGLDLKMKVGLDNTTTSAIPYVFMNVGRSDNLDIIAMTLQELITDTVSLGKALLILCNDVELLGMVMLTYLLFEDRFDLTLNEAIDIVHDQFPTARIPQPLPDVLFEPPFLFCICDSGKEEEGKPCSVHD